MDNVIAALKHSHRVCEIELWRVPSLLSEKVLAAMQGPFSALTDLRLASKDAGRSRFVVGRVYSKPTKSFVEQYSIPGTTETSYVCHSPCRSFPP
jgi:hypothetical protein